MFGTLKGLLRRCLGVQISSQGVFGCLGFIHSLMFFWEVDGNDTEMFYLLLDMRARVPNFGGVILTALLIPQTVNHYYRMRSLNQRCSGIKISENTIWTNTISNHGSCAFINLLCITHPKSCLCIISITFPCPNFSTHQRSSGEQRETNPCIPWDLLVGLTRILMSWLMK